jgi:hypothetical protein
MRIPKGLGCTVLLLAIACTDGGLEPVVPEPVNVVTGALAEAIQGVEYSQQLEAAGGSGSYSWVLSAGSLPAGLTLSPTGAIHGTPAATGTSTFRARVTDAGGRSATAELVIPVVQALAVHTGALPDAEQGVQYAAQLQAAGGRGTHAWTLSGEAASWLTVSTSGLLTGTPTAPGVSTLAVTVADEAGQQATRQIPIVVRAPLDVASIALPGATQGRAYAAQLVAAGGDGVYSWTVQSGLLPAGLALGTGGALTGIPSVGGAFAFTVRVSDGAGRVATRYLSMTVDLAPTISTGSLPAGDVGTPYAAQLQAAGGSGAYTWSLTGGALPDGLTLSTSGAISGTPTVIGSSAFTVRVTDEAGATDSRALTIVVASIEYLSSGIAVTGISGAAGSHLYFAIHVPAGATRLTVSTSGGSGDVDLYVHHGALPQQYVYHCRPYRPGNDETCTFVAPAAGAWYVMLRGHASYAGVRLLATVEE